MAIPGPSEPEPAQARWFRSLGREVNEEYMRLHQEALKDPQQAGHGGESTWAGVLRQWLPSAYEVVTRKYIIPEIGDEKFETDIIIINPSYPRPLRGHEEILAGGVAAAFSVKLTLDSAGIRDGIKRAVALRRTLRPRLGTPGMRWRHLFQLGYSRTRTTGSCPDLRLQRISLIGFGNLTMNLCGTPAKVSTTCAYQISRCSQLCGSRICPLQP